MEGLDIWLSLKLMGVVKVNNMRVHDSAGESIYVCGRLLLLSPLEGQGVQAVRSSGTSINAYFKNC